MRKKEEQPKRKEVEGTKEIRKDLREGNREEMVCACANALKSRFKLFLCNKKSLSWEPSLIALSLSSSVCVLCTLGQSDQLETFYERVQDEANFLHSHESVCAQNYMCLGSYSECKQVLCLFVCLSLCSDLGTVLFFMYFSRLLKSFYS